MEHVKFNILID